MNKTIFRGILAMLTLLAASAQAQTVSCFCEHFASQNDQFCEGSPAGNRIVVKAEIPSIPPIWLYRYEWSTSPGAYIANQGNIMPFATADCIGGSSCTLIAYLDVFYYDTITQQEYFLGGTQCGSGTGGGL